MGLYLVSGWQLFLSCGPMAWPLLAISILAVWIIVERWLYLNGITGDTQALLASLRDRLKHNQVKQALEICDAQGTPAALVLKAGIITYDRPRTQVKEAMEDAALYEIPKLEKNLSLVLVLSQIAPLIGFLGTLVGLAKVFYALQQHAVVSVPLADMAVSAGLGESIISSIAGMTIAIPVFISYHYLSERVRDSILEIEKASTELVNYLTE